MKLTGDEKEFIAEMAAEPGSPNEWCNFDPPFVRRAYERFVRRGWLEYKFDGRERQFRWTGSGREALANKGSET